MEHSNNSESFERSRAIGFNANDSDEEMRPQVNAGLTDAVAVLESAVQQLRWDLDESEEEASGFPIVNEPTISVLSAVGRTANEEQIPVSRSNLG